MPNSPKITDWRIRKLSEGVRKDLFSYVPKHRLTGMDPAWFMDVLDAYGRPDLAVSALKEMDLPVPTHEPHEPTKLKVIVTNESYQNLYEVDVEDAYSVRGQLPIDAARRLFRELAGA